MSLRNTLVSTIFVQKGSTFLVIRSSCIWNIAYFNFERFTYSLFICNLVNGQFFDSRNVAPNYVGLCLCNFISMIATGVFSGAELEISNIVI